MLIIIIRLLLVCRTILPSEMRPRSEKQRLFYYSLYARSTRVTRDCDFLIRARRVKKNSNANIMMMYTNIFVVDKFRRNHRGIIEPSDWYTRFNADIRESGCNEPLFFSENIYGN